MPRRTSGKAESQLGKFVFQIILLAMLLPAASLTGCAKTVTVAPTPVSTDLSSEGEPNLHIGNFLVLEEATDAPEIPYASSGNGTQLEDPCFDVETGLKAWETSNPKILDLIDANKDALNDTLRRWIESAFEAFEDDGLGGGFELTLTDQVVLHAAPKNTRLSLNQTCVSVSMGQATFPAQVITALFGVKTIDLKNNEPFDPKTVKKMRKAAKEMGIKLQATPAEYPRAEGEDGKPLKDEKGRPLFEAPDGTHILRMKIPAPKDRPIFDWRLRFKEPLYFAAGDLPEGSWASETDPLLCEAFLVFDDVTPQPLDCEKLPEAGFSVSRGAGDSEVELKVTVDGVLTSKTVRYAEQTEVVASGRVVAWVTVDRVEEGAKIQVDGAVLFPGEQLDAYNAKPPRPASSNKPKPKPVSNKPRPKPKPKPKPSDKPKPANKPKPAEPPPPPPPVY